VLPFILEPPSKNSGCGPALPLPDTKGMVYNCALYVSASAQSVPFVLHVWCHTLINVFSVSCVHAMSLWNIA